MGRSTGPRPVGSSFTPRRFFVPGRFSTFFFVVFLAAMGLAVTPWPPSANPESENADRRLLPRSALRVHSQRGGTPREGLLSDERLQVVDGVVLELEALRVLVTRGALHVLAGCLRLLHGALHEFLGRLAT